MNNLFFYNFDDAFKHLQQEKGLGRQGYWFPISGGFMVRTW